MPVRDGADWIGAAIASIVGQPWHELELIVVDDGSTDATAVLVERWMRADPRVRMIPGPAQGPGPAFDHGVERARSQIVARMDADDVALPWRIPQQVAYLDAHPDVVMLGGFIDVIDPGGGLIGHEVVPLDDDDIRRRLPAHCFFNPTLAFRRVALEEVGGHRSIFGAGDDVDMALRMTSSGRVANLAQPLVRYRVHGGSASDRDLRQQTIAVLVAQESHRRRARGEADPVDRATSLDEAVTLLELDPQVIEAAVERAVAGRAAMLGRAGLPRAARRLSGPGVSVLAPFGRRARVRTAGRVGAAVRLRDDYIGCRRSCPPGSALALAIGARRAVSRAQTGLRVLADRTRMVGRTDDRSHGQPESR